MQALHCFRTLRGFSEQSRCSALPLCVTELQLVAMAMVVCPALEKAGVAVDQLFTPQLVENIGALLKKGRETGEKQGIWDQIRQEGTKANIAWRAHVPPEYCGVDKGNRSSLGVGGSESQHLGYKILSVGWSWQKCNDSNLFQMPPQPLAAAQVEFNDNLVALSDGLVPPLASLTHVSFGGGHTNTWLRQVKAGTRCILGDKAINSKKVTDEHGMLNAEYMECL